MITVIQAVYGAEKGVVDVTGLVQGLVDRGMFIFKADTKTLAGNKDPAQGQTKHFAMNYTVGPSRYTFACKENEMVTLDPPGNLRVLGAAYGTINSTSRSDPGTGSRDVTAIVQQLLDRGLRSFKTDNTLFGDTFNGPRKNFGMVYVSVLNPGVRKAVASEEGETVTVSP